jgi:hypothetical protein
MYGGADCAGAAACAPLAAPSVAPQLLQNLFSAVLSTPQRGQNIVILLSSGGGGC